MPFPTDDAPLPGRFRPRLTLLTLTRGDGLLGLRAAAGFGPRGAKLTVARVEWTYVAGGLRWDTPAQARLLNARAPRTELLRGAWDERVLMQRDLTAEADARDALWATGLRPLPPEALQWRSREAADDHAGLWWSLPEEAQFGDFWAEQVPRLQAQGWSVVVRPGFAHQSVPVEAWRLVIDPATGDALGHELLEPPGARGQALSALRQPPREGSWMLSLGVEVDGETLDLAPLLADLLRRDARWLDAREIGAIDDAALILLRAPGGRRIEAPAAPLKAIVGAMLDLLTDPRRKDGPLQLSTWEAHRVEALRLSLLDTQAARAGEQGGWQLKGDAGLAELAQRLRAAGSPPPVAAPAGLGVQLRPYQQHGVAWLQYLREHHLAGILADDMGLGKTVQVLAHLLIEQQAGRLEQPALIVLPTSLIANWQAEAQRIAPSLRVLTLQGAARSRHFARIASHDVVFTTYPLLWRDIDALQAQPWHLVILDEAQMAKNAAGRAATALRRLRSRHRLCVTGTPLENHLGELWAHFDFLMPGFLGDARSFARLWRKPIETGGETLRAQLLAQRVRSFILRRRKQDVATELPPKTEVIRRVQLQGQQRALYESVRVAADEQVRRVLQRKSFAGAQIAILDALLKLRQVCCDPWLVKGPRMPPTMERAKMAWLLDMLPELVDEGRRVLVFSQFTEMLALVQAELATLSLPCLALTGDTPVAARGAIVQRFQAKAEPILLVSLKAGGVGLNLTAADTVIHLDPWWNPAVERQATDRAHRIGQDQPVFVYKLVVEGSIEERMLALQARKAALAEGVLGHDAAAAPKFSAEDLQGLLAPLV
ncbi:DEAD/DEAH box helicase [Piscinibacter sp.]|uniref:DEAD/DEAH box helicase n=1 Tax=Piscinibacter sp. TaxID=1903157 RepID=UPI002CBEB423|nr:DEAD/DEAH box helicase [Albitalea sp.]HUG26437.1 DEAD/DEAH box helicase [Albitalea sp.]